ncbi:carbohydrate ABC transporter permease [Muricomes sp. OA1]|uniref:Carbohydrate ABC transporter permease n=1 Tax=Hungatella hathewayi TaxID=154046 RepID=A0A3E2X225_9FIRM|nr:MULTISPECIES: carbohydrate ABC transporter permease [Clostridia]MCH1971672.1 carbohydrate ABC transporter permease [Muricomes sp. OA1]MRM87803.1 carbohydrate ABC transporter permease [Faecalicatena contorta]RGC35541.1 carbohydrate ABC transporter permease [Hungatella hathewayi]GKH34941.1 sugar ABC transporter permease [Faecalicatena contorta]
MVRKKKILSFIKALILWLLSILVFIPLLIILLNSLKTQGESVAMEFSMPTQWVLGNYQEVMETVDIFQAFSNSMLISVFTVLIATTGAALASYVMARRKTKLHNKIYLFFLVGLVAPLNMVPAVLVLQKIHLTNSLVGLVLLYSALVTPFTVFLYYGFIGSIPREIDEAAIIDGCGPLTLFGKVIFPLLKPVTVTVIILNFMSSWNDFVTPFYVINESRKMPLTTMVYSFFGLYQRSWNLVCVIMVMIIVPSIVVYALGQRYIIAGMTAGAVKG